MTEEKRSSSLKNKKYSEIYGEEEGKRRSQEKRKTLLKNNFPVIKKEAVEVFGLEFLDENYEGAKIKHHWKCLECGNSIFMSWNNIKGNKYKCKCKPSNLPENKIIKCLGPECENEIEIPIRSNIKFCSDECKEKFLQQNS